MMHGQINIKLVSGVQTALINEEHSATLNEVSFFSHRPSRHLRVKGSVRGSLNSNLFVFYQSIKLIIRVGTDQGNRLKNGKSDTPHKSAFRISSNVRFCECSEINTLNCFVGYLLPVTYSAKVILQ
jgi:hypothetical protein